MKKLSLSGAALKWVAIVTMFMDHLAAAVLMPAYGVYFSFSGLSWIDMLMATDSWMFRFCLFLRLAGRLAFPLFCFLLVEGICHTRSVVRYGRNLFVMALLSEFPFYLCFGNHGNVMWTLLLGLLACMCLKKGWVASLFIWPFAFLGMVAVAVLAEVLQTDYGAFGVVLILVLYILREKRVLRCLAGAVLSAMKSLTAPLAFLFIWFYNGTRGRQMKWFFYLFYPVHLLLLYGISCMFFV